MDYLFDIESGKIRWVTEKPDILSLKDGRYKMSVKKARGKVSGNQYRYYYGVIVKYWKEESGFGNDQQDFELKRAFARSKGWLNKYGEPIVPSKSLDFDTKDQEELNKYARELFSDMFNGIIPLPNETEFDY